MTEARRAILDRMRRALGATGEDAARLDAVRARLAARPAGVIPARGGGTPAARVALFCRMATEAAASVERVAKAQGVPKAVTAYLRGQNLAPRLRMGHDKRLLAMPWVAQRTLQIRYGPSDGEDEVAVSHAAAGIAETGTLAMVSGRENPTTLNFLPDRHIVVVEARDIEGDMEAVWTKLRKIHGRGGMPRTVNLVTGPSRSADIEQTLLLGAHGPRALHILIVG